MSYTKNVLFRDKTNRFLPFQRTLGLDERGRLFQSVGDNTGNLTSINRKADSLQGLSIRSKKGCFAFGKTGRTKNTAGTDVWAVQRVIAAMSGSLSTQQLAELLPAKLLVFGLVGAALDSAVNDIAQLIEAHFLADTLRGGAVEQIYLVVVRAVKYNHDVSVVEPSVQFDAQCRQVPVDGGSKFGDAP